MQHILKFVLVVHGHLVFFTQGPREINGVNHFLLGDPAYPLMDWLIKGYTHSPRITPEQESFYVYLSSARTTVEIVFGRLKSHWWSSGAVGCGCW